MKLPNGSTVRNRTFKLILRFSFAKPPRVLLKLRILQCSVVYGSTVNLLLRSLLQ